MALPLLANELRLSLRRTGTFVAAFTFCSILTVLFSLLWALTAGGKNDLSLNRDLTSFVLLRGFLVVGYLAFCLHGGIAASRVLILEREKNTLPLLQVSPLRGWSLMLQKTLLPFLLEMLLFLGFLPVLSLVFTIGGISLAEFAYQLTSLAVWIGTSVAIGLWFSSRSRSAAVATRNTFCLLCVLIAGLPVLSQSISAWTSSYLVLLPQNSSVRRGVEMVTFFLYAVSPSGMLHAGDFDPMSITGSRPRLPGIVVLLLSNASILGNPKVTPPPHNMFPWVAHLLIQFLFFWRGVVNWRRSQVISEDVGSRSAVSSSDWEGTRREMFAPGWWAVFQSEDRQVFRHGSLNSPGLLAGYTFSLIFAGLFVPVQILLGIPVLLVALAALALAPNAFRRERERLTAVFLLSTPLMPRQYLLGKWFYYFTIAVLVWALAFPGLLVRWTLDWDSLDTFVPYICLVLFIPALTLEGIAAGLRIRRQSNPKRFLIPAAILALGALVKPLRNSMRVVIFEITRLADHNPWIFTYLMPLVCIGTAALLLSRGVDALPDESLRSRRIRKTIGICAFLYLVLDAFSMSVVAPDFSGSNLRNQLRCLLGALCLNWYPWFYFARRPDKWWRMRLLGEEE